MEELIKSLKVRVGAVTGFQLGQNTRETKYFETVDAIKKGATEIDTVINIRELQKGNVALVKGEIEDLATLCREAGVIRSKKIKVILDNTDLLRTVSSVFLFHNGNKAFH